MENTCEVNLLQVSRRFGDVAAVDGVSLQVRHGEFLTLLGPSGCGKTTLLRMIAGFERPDAGRVFLGGRDVTDLPPYKRNVTTVFQSYALFPHMSVYENVAFGLQRRRTPGAEVKRRVKEALDLVRLAGLEERRLNQLSGGQQQRVALARALVVEPGVLLLDEPLAALDLKLRKQMQVELKSLQRRLGISFVYVTHDQEEALTMSDRIAVMNAGRVEQIGSADEIYERPVNEFVAGFIGASNIIEGLVVSRSGDALLIGIGDARISARADGAEPGSRLRLMVRPEKVRLLTPDAPGAIFGTIASAVYLGDSTRYTVTTREGQSIEVLEQNSEAADKADARIGQEVCCKWDVGSAIVLRS